MPLSPENGTFGFRFFLIGFIMLLFLLIRRQWRSASVRRDEVIRLMAFATEESYVAEVQASVDYVSSLASDFVVHRCAVCLYPTTTRCAQCKSVRYWFVLESDQNLLLLFSVLFICLVFSSSSSVVLASVRFFIGEEVTRTNVDRLRRRRLLNLMVKFWHFICKDSHLVIGF